PARACTGISCRPRQSDRWPWFLLFARAALCAMANKYPCYFRSFHWSHYNRQRCWGFLAFYRKGVGARASVSSRGAGLWNTCSSCFAVSFAMAERLVSFLDLLFV